MSEHVSEVESQRVKGKFYIVCVDDVDYRFDHSPVTAGEIMDKAGVPRSVGLLLINNDGTQRSVDEDEEFDLKPGRRFKKKPRFKRG